MFEILRPLGEWNEPARVLADGLVAEHDGAPHVAHGLAAQRHEHVEGGQRGPLVTRPRVEAVLSIPRLLAHLPVKTINMIRMKMCWDLVYKTTTLILLQI